MIQKDLSPEALKQFLEKNFEGYVQAELPNKTGFNLYSPDAGIVFSCYHTGTLVINASEKYLASARKLFPDNKVKKSKGERTQLFLDGVRCYSRPYTLQDFIQIEPFSGVRRYYLQCNRGYFTYTAQENNGNSLTSEWETRYEFWDMEFSADPKINLTLSELLAEISKINQ